MYKSMLSWSISRSGKDPYATVKKQTAAATQEAVNSGVKLVSQPPRKQENSRMTNLTAGTVRGGERGARLFSLLFDRRERLSCVPDCPARAERERRSQGKFSACALPRRATQSTRPKPPAAANESSFFCCFAFNPLSPPRARAFFLRSAPSHTPAVLCYIPFCLFSGR